MNLTLSTLLTLSCHFLRTSIYPFDSVKSIQQTSAENVSILNVVRCTGMLKLYRGVGIGFMRGGVGGAACFIGADLFRTALCSS